MSAKLSIFWSCSSFSYFIFAIHFPVFFAIVAVFFALNAVEEIIRSCSEKNYREILLITGKGLHSTQNDVYKSSELSKLRFSVPEFIKSNTEISKLVLSIINAPQKDGGEGALLIKLKKL